MPTIQIDKLSIDYTLRLDKRRKTIQLKLLPTAVVEIAAPGKLSEQEVAQILATKKSWLTKRITKLASLAANPVNQVLATGHKLLYKGEPHTLTILSGYAEPDVAVKPGELLIMLPGTVLAKEEPVLAAKVLKTWLFKQAGTHFLDKTKHWAAIIGVCPARITIKDQKTRWGSCSSLGNINYNWRIIMAPPAVADYLVIHELCHLLEPNHSARFWRQVGRFMPNYKENRRWLTDNGKLLSRIL